MKTIRSCPAIRAGFLTACLTTLSLLNASPDVRAQGSLTPSGAPSPTFKTLRQVEPRTDVQTLPGDPTCLRIISAPGSYYLTTNIVGVPGLQGISIRTNNVTLDLNGFALLGVMGSADAINVAGALHDIEIRSGNIEGWSGDGIDSSGPTTDCRFINVRSYRNGGNGFNLGLRSVLTECQAATNASVGILVASGILKHCTAVGNGFFNGLGIPVDMHGIYVIGGEEAEIRDCIANYNYADGINVGLGMGLAGGSIISGCTTKGNFDDGIQVSSSCVVRGNNSLANGMNGIHVAMAGSGNRIEDNQVSFHFAGVMCDPPSFGNLIMKNSAQGNVFGYMVPPGNHLAAITFFPGVGFVGASPWSNFEF